MFGFGYNKEKTRAAAERYLEQNKLQNAVTEYEKILKEEPRDLAILNTVGDVYSRLGQNEKAIERFRVVGEAYAADGFLLKAIAIYRKITKLDPNGLAAMEKLSELYRKQGLVSDARSMLLAAADGYARKGQNKETLRLLKQLVLFDPENVQVITRTADLMIQGGQKNDAREMLSQTASTLVNRHALDPAQKILDRLIALDASNQRAQELRAQVAFELGDHAKAIELYEAMTGLDSSAEGLRNLLTAQLKTDRIADAVLVARKLVSTFHEPDGVLKVAARLYQQGEIVPALNLYSEFSDNIFTHDKEDVVAHLHGAVSRVRTNPEALQTLYDLFQCAGETSMIAEVLELMAHAAVQAGQFERARDAYKELIEREPENVAHVQGYRQMCARLGATPDTKATAQRATPAPAEAQSLEDFLNTEEPELPSQSYPPEVEDEIATALTEADLCESFSSKTRGITALKNALISAPQDLRLNKTLAMLCKQEGDTVTAARCYATMQRVLEELDKTDAAAYYASLAGQAETTEWETKPNEFEAGEFNLSEGSTEEIDISSEWESVWQDASETPAATSSAPPAAAPPAPQAPAPVADSFASSAPATESATVAELLEEARFCLSQQIWSEAESAIERLAALSPNHSELAALRAQLPQGAAPEPTSSAPSEPVEVIEISELQPTTGFPWTAPEEAPTLSSLASELESELGDGFTPAPPPRPAPTPRPMAAAAPAPAPVVASLSAAAAPVTELPGLELPEEAVELTPSVFGDLLQDFERDLASPQDEDEDPETHFNLGIAFREMGLLDEAIGELQKVCKMAQRLTPERAQQAYIWLATCFVEKSVPEASFKWFQRALDTAPDEESRTAVNYELACAYENAGRKREALEHFMEVYGTNIDYRDIADRIRELRAAL